jgi:adenosylmethionine-8-amino-7-oxononanoate aminotransferase
MTRALERFHDHPHVGEVRQTGMIAALEMVKDRSSRTLYDWRERRGLRVYQHALTRGALLRPLANVTYFMPPYIITPEQIDFLADVAWEGINKATQD